MKHLKFFAAILGLLAFVSCHEKDELSLDNAPEKAKNSNTLTIKKANAFVSLFSDYLGEKPGTKSEEQREVDFIDVLVERGDTLMYAFNYKNDAGYILLGAADTYFPILSHNSSGHLRFNEISIESPVYSVIQSFKGIIRDAKASPDYDSEYYERWKDLGNSDYTYEIIPCETPEFITDTKGRRKTSAGKKNIYPQTGMELKYWTQEGGYNYYAKNKACIGCPAIAIGMLLYDMNSRMLGDPTTTYPSFSYYYDAYDIKDRTDGTETAQKLRTIADNIPGYDWGDKKDAGSGASLDEIVTGLRRLGFTQAAAVNYNFETLYSNFTYKGINYFGNEQTFERGVLLLAGDYYSNVGHIWFCDGYYEQAYEVVKRGIFGRVKDRWNEYEDRIYMNWGWGEDGGNGWYTASDTFWVSSEYGSVSLKANPKIIVNLSHYEFPYNLINQ